MRTNQNGDEPRESNESVKPQTREGGHKQKWRFVYTLFSRWNNTRQQQHETTYKEQNTTLGFERRKTK